MNTQRIKIGIFAVTFAIINAFTAKASSNGDNQIPASTTNPGQAE